MLIEIPVHSFTLPDHPEVWAWKDDLGKWHVAWEPCTRYPEGKEVEPKKNGNSTVFYVGNNRFYPRTLATIREEKKGRKSSIRDKYRKRYLAALAERVEFQNKT